MVEYLMLLAGTILFAAVVMAIVNATDNRTPEQIERLRTEFHVYILGSSRASVAAINPSNVEYLAKAMHEVTK